MLRRGRFYRRFVRKDAPEKTGDSLKYGTLLHTWGELLVGLDGSAFWDRVRVAQANVCTAAAQLGKAAEAWLAELPPDAIPISPADYERLRLQTEQILLNGAAAELLSQSTLREFNGRFLLPRWCARRSGCAPLIAAWGHCNCV